MTPPGKGGAISVDLGASGLAESWSAGQVTADGSGASGPREEAGTVTLTIWDDTLAAAWGRQALTGAVYDLDIDGTVLGRVRVRTVRTERMGAGLRGLSLVRSVLTCDRVTA